MLNKEVFKQKLQDLIDFYPNWGIKVDDPKVIAKWYTIFKDDTDEQFQNMVNAHIKTVAFNPTVASLIECKPNSNVKIINGEKYVGGLRYYE